MCEQQVQGLEGEKKGIIGNKSEGQPEARVFGFYSEWNGKPLGRFTVERRGDKTL